MTPMERAARALCKLDGQSGDAAHLWQSYLPQVRVVLDAIHEPSLRMTEAGAIIIRYVGPDESPAGYQGDAANVWRFMIDAMYRDISKDPDRV
jgi:hypothetical protein